jgi:alpha-mannosidase
MWVEADCNLSGSESLARQFLLGRAFYREYFGSEAESPVMWLPDVFGYAWNLPQLIKQAGLEYFFTIKLGWNQYNRLPYDSFWWQGLDGTKVLTHFSTTPDLGGYGVSTYNTEATPYQTLGTWNNFQQKELQQNLLMCFGYGDGGGGPTREMLENIREMGNFPATPRARHGKAGDFFKDLEVASGDRLPIWNGELYLELHRGTFTTQARNKRANRQSEFLLHDAEFLAVVAAALDANYQYPVDVLRQAWQLVCLNQFHDIIPGSSITAVYTESLQQYKEIREMGLAVRDAALKTIADQLGGDLLLVNPTAFTQNTLAFWPDHLADDQQLQTVDGTRLLTQSVAAGTLIAVEALPGLSVTPLMFEQGNVAVQAKGTLTAAPGLLENDFLRVELDRAGDIIRIFDKANQREVLPPGAIANQLQIFQDRPQSWEAWDVDIYFDDTMWLADAATSVTVVETGPLRATLEIRRQVLHSEIVQRVSLMYNSPQLDFDTTVYWQERRILLKVAFPVDILSPTATYEIQWGNVERPTHQNTSWDWARFETCAQKWVDLSEGDYGVSLLNDCKYGHDIKDNVIRLSLLRGPIIPDPEADQGEHHFVYSLLPHAGHWNETTIAAAYALNNPLLVVEGNGQKGQSTGSFIAVDQPNVVIETVKQAEDGNGVIVRLYESRRKRGEIVLTTNFALDKVWQTNLLEENETALTPEGNRVRFLIKPYQIVTLRLEPA